MMDRGTLVDHDGRAAVRFRREYAHPVERLWAAITEPDELERWFPSTVRMAGQVAGGPHSETTESWREHYEDYVAAGMPSGAYIPSGA